MTCYYGHIEIVKLLLNDQRVDTNKADDAGTRPFWIVCQEGDLQIIRYILASGREGNLIEKDKDGKTAIDIAREGVTREKRNWENEEDSQKRRENCIKIVELLESFEKSPNETRFKLRIQLGLLCNI